MCRACPAAVLAANARSEASCAELTLLPRVQPLRRAKHLEPSHAAILCAAIMKSETSCAEMTLLRCRAPTIARAHATAPRAAIVKSEASCARAAT